MPKRYRTKLINFRLTPAEHVALGQLARVHRHELPYSRYGRYIDRPDISDYLRALILRDAKARGIAFPALGTDADGADGDSER